VPNADGPGFPSSPFRCTGGPQSRLEATKENLELVGGLADRKGLGLNTTTNMVRQTHNRAPNLIIFRHIMLWIAEDCARKKLPV